VRAAPGRVRRTAGLLLLASLLGVVVLLVQARSGAPLGVDRAVHRWTLEHRDPALTRLAIGVTTTGSGLPAYLLAALAGLATTPAAGRWVRAVLCALALAVGQLLRLGLALRIGRARPPAADWAWHAAGPALPSGHATSSALVAALLCLAARGLTGRRRAVVPVLAVAWAATVGLTRVYLGVHWPSDVVAGWLLAGTLSLLGGPLLVRLLRRASGRDRAQPAR